MISSVKKRVKTIKPTVLMYVKYTRKRTRADNVCVKCNILAQRCLSAGARRDFVMLL